MRLTGPPSVEELWSEGGDIEPEQHPGESQAGFATPIPKNFRPSLPKSKAIPNSISTSSLNDLLLTKPFLRWQQPAGADGAQERPRSMEVHKLDLNQVFGQENKSLTGSNQDISRELDEIR